MDPRKILGLPENAQLDRRDIKRQYRELAKKFHPDKGGDPDAFKLMSYAFKKLYHELKVAEVEKQFHELKFAYKEQYGDIAAGNSDLGRREGPAPTNDSEGFHKDFNAVFDEKRTPNPEFDFGYGESMAESSKTREDIDIRVHPKLEKLLKKKKKHDSKKQHAVFNKVFDEDVDFVSTETTVVTKFRVPEPLESCKSIPCSVIGESKLKDYSGENTTIRKLNYTDYMSAHNTSRLVSKKKHSEHGKYVSERPKDVDSIQNQRTNTAMTPEEIDAYNKMLREKNAREEMRLKAVQAADNAASIEYTSIMKDDILSRYRQIF